MAGARMTDGRYARIVAFFSDGAAGVAVWSGGYISVSFFLCGCVCVCVCLVRSSSLVLRSKTEMSVSGSLISFNGQKETGSRQCHDNRRPFVTFRTFLVSLLLVLLLLLLLLLVSLFFLPVLGAEEEKSPVGKFSFPTGRKWRCG